MSHDWTLGVIYEQIFSLLLGLFDWMSLRLKRIDEEIARICLYCSFLCFLIFASQVSDSLSDTWLAKMLFSVKVHLCNVLYHNAKNPMILYIRDVRQTLGAFELIQNIV